MKPLEKVNSKGKILGGGKPKDTTLGKDIGPHATNSMGKFINKPYSPNADSMAVDKKGK